MRPIALAVILLALAPSPRSPLAATLGAGLQARIAAAQPDDVLPVILRFEDADLSDFPGRRADGRAVIARLQAHAARSQARVLAYLRSQRLDAGARPYWITNAIALRAPVGRIAELAGLGELSSIEYDEPVWFDPGVGASTGGGNPDWGGVMVRADDVWKTYGLDGTGIVVGSLDTGFDPNHPALAGKWRGGTNSWRDFVQGLPNPYDDHGHGSHTIGTMVGGDGPGPFAPDIGLAYNARFIAAKVLNSSNSFSSGSVVIAGAEWMLDPDGNPATDDFPHVINNSWLFFQQDYQGYRPVVTAWRAVGIVPVFCIGNYGPNAVTTAPPGNYDNVIGVGATDPNDQIASYSSRGPSPVGDAFPDDRRKPDLSAPGYAVLSSLPGGGYGAWYGTSMAAPHVAGAVALMLQAHPGPMSLDEVRSALLSTVVDRGAPGYDHDFGYGRLDAFAAVTQAYTPGIQLSGSPGGHVVYLSWNASSLPGVLRYDIYRSAQVDDLSPPVVGSATGTSYVDQGRFGTGYYKVKAVSASATSPFSNEVAITVCGSETITCLPVDANATAPVPADLDGDGGLDIVMASTLASGAVKVTLGAGLNFGPAASFPSGSRPIDIVVADFDGDAVPDLAVANNITSGTVSILRGNGDGTFQAPVPYAASQTPSGVAAGDFDQDGITDLAVSNYGLNNVSILIGHGANGVGNGTFAAPVNYNVGTRPNGIVVADFNEDGALDIATPNNGSGRVGVMLGNMTAGKANGTFGVGLLYVCGTSPFGLTTGDFDEDGIVDLAVTRNVDPGFVAILRGQGSGGVGDGTFGAAVQYPSGSLPQGITTADMNGDGITDLCVANTAASGTVSVLLGTGTGGVGDGGFEPSIPIPAGANPADVTAADFDGDGGVDLVATSVSGLQNLCVLQGSCTPEVGTGLTVVAPNGGESWPASTSQTISWTKDPGVVSVAIELSRDGGATWQTIATDQSGTSFDWWVTNPQTGAGAARVRIRDDRVSSSDGSDAGFTIAPDIRLGVDPPAPALAPALAIVNPSLHGMRVRFRLGDAPSATLEVLDVSGRRVLAREVSGLGAGEHVLDLGRDLGAGVYLVRLVQGDVRLMRKAAVLR